MWTWENIHDFFSDMESQARFENYQNHAREMLNLVVQIQSTSELGEIEPFLTLGALCLFNHKSEQTIALYIDRPGYCRVTQHKNRNVMDAEYEEYVPTNEVIQILKKHFSNR